MIALCQLKIWDGRSVGNMSTNVYAKFCWAPLRIKKALGIFRELTPTTTTTATRVAFWDPPSESNKIMKKYNGLRVPVRAWAPKYMNGPPSNMKSSLPIWICTCPSTIRVKWLADLPRSYRVRLQLGSESVTLTTTSCFRRRRSTFSDMTRWLNCIRAVEYITYDHSTSAAFLIQFTGFIQTLEHCFPGLSRTCKDQIPRFSRTQKCVFKRTFQDTLRSQTWLHDVKKCTYQISFRCKCITVNKRKCNTCGDKMHTMHYNEFLL